MLRSDRGKDPRIDAVAGRGIRFSDYYAAARFAPFAGGLLTGCYPRRVGNEIWVHRADSPTGIHPDELTLPELLKDHGYKTACIGKWHLGFHEPFLPRNQGFDHYFGLLHNLDPVETVFFEEKGGVPLIRNGKVVKRPVEVNELTRVYTDEALDFISATRKDRSSFTCLTPCCVRSGSAKNSRKFQLGRIWRCHSGTRSQRWPNP